jgi:hypothetical protein
MAQGPLCVLGVLCEAVGVSSAPVSSAGIPEKLMFVIPAKAGIQCFSAVCGKNGLDPGLRRDDGR